MGYTDLTLKKLFSLSGNVCAFPGCTAPIIDTTNGVMTGQICHIKGKSRNGPRYDPNQTEEERNGYDNLLVMCAAHNKIVDDEATQNQYPVEVLRQYKQNHEANYRNSVVRNDIVERIIESLLHVIPLRTTVKLEPIVQALLVKVDHEMKLDYYDFRIGLRNDGSTTVKDFRLEVEIPNAYANPSHSSVAEVREHMRGDVTLYRRTEKQLRDFILYPNDTWKHVLNLDFLVNERQYIDGITENIIVIVYTGDTLLSRKPHPIVTLLNEERTRAILNPKRVALKKIYEAARNFQGDSGDPTDVTIYLADEPITGKRGVQLENAYNTAKALVKAGWLRMESDDAMEVRLTDAGVRAAE